MSRFTDPLKNIRELLDKQSKLFSNLSIPNHNLDILSKLYNPSIGEQILKTSSALKISTFVSQFEMINRQSHLLPDDQLIETINRMKSNPPIQSLKIIEEMSRKNSVNEMMKLLPSQMNLLHKKLNDQKNMIKNQDIDILNLFTESFQKLENMQKSINLSYESINKSIFKSFDRLSKIKIDFSDLWKSSSIIYESITRNVNIFKESNIAKYFNIIDNIIEEENNEEIDQLIDEFQKSFIEDNNQQSKNLLSFEGKCSLLLTIFIFFYTLYSQSITDKKINQIIEQENSTSYKVEKLLEVQENFIEKFISNNNQNQADYQIINGIVNLRSKPDENSEKLGILYPNQKVIVEKKDGEWFYVLYFNYLDNLTGTGWVYSKYIDKIDDKI